MITSAQPTLSPDDIRAWEGVTREIAHTGRLVLGPYTARFEDEFARCMGTRDAVAVSSGTAALEIVLRWIDVRGRHVVLPASAFIAQAVATMRAGGSPIFAPIDPQTFGLMFNAMLSKFLAEHPTPRPVVMLTHLAGIVDPCAAANVSWCVPDIFVIEDASHAHGAMHQGRPIGSLGVAGCFSLGATKILTSGGAGGMITTNDAGLASFARRQRTHGGLSSAGSDARSLDSEYGYGWLMPESSAAFGSIQLRTLPDLLHRRARIAARYRAHLGSLGTTICQLPPEIHGSVWWKFPVVLGDIARHTAVLTALHHVGVEVGRLYWPPAFDLLNLPVFDGKTEVARSLLARQIALPVHPHMSDADVAFICDVMVRCLID